MLATTDATPPSVPQPPQQRKPDPPPWRILGALLCASAALLALYGWTVGSAQLLWLEGLVATGAVCVGGLLGFLFGIPRTAGRVAGDSDTLSAAGDGTSVRRVPGSGYRPSTNLEQISDWLTKILIGVGLVEFRELGAALWNVGQLVSSQLPQPLGTPILTPLVIIAFSVVGFVSGYLWTRIYFMEILATADKQVEDLFHQVAVVTKELSAQKATLAEQRESLQEQVIETQGVKKVADLLATNRRLAAPAESAPEYVPSSEATAGWPDDLLKKLKDFIEAPANWDSNPTLDIFGSPPAEGNGRSLIVEIVSNLGDALVLSATLKRIEGDPLDGPVSFLLHPTFPDRVLSVAPRDDAAESSFYSNGWFTLVAIADRGRTILSRDLRQLPHAPDWFISN